MRPTHVQIDLSAIAHNIREIRKKVRPAKIMAVVKANAYGHGVQRVAEIALKNGASYLAVALIEEAIELREMGFREPILVFGGELQCQLEEILVHDLEITVFSSEFAGLLNEQALRQNRRIKVHIKVDTGMGRVGVAWTEAAEFVHHISSLKGIEIIGLYTHFSTSDERDQRFAHIQLDRFNRVLSSVRSANIRIPMVHAANSGAIIDLPEAYFDMVRPGIMMYGYYPSFETSESVPIRPAMTFKSKITYLKQVSAETPVSYGRLYVTRSATRIATIPVGYADGYNRLLSDRGQVIIRGRKYPVVGRVCMDQILVDIGMNEPIETGDEVILFGKAGDVEFGVNELCKILNTIPYEVCCWISKRVPRVYIERSH